MVGVPGRRCVACVNVGGFRRYSIVVSLHHV
jgi:hypothetical protein